MQDVVLKDLLNVISKEQNFGVNLISSNIEKKTLYLVSEFKDDYELLKKVYGNSIVKEIECGFDGELLIYCEV